MSTSDRTDDVRRAAARALNAAMIAVKTTNEDAGNCCGIVESRVRRWRSVDPKDLEAMPALGVLTGCSWELFEEIVARLREERLTLHGPSTALTPEAALAAASSADLEVASYSFVALSDGHASGPESARALELRAKSEAAWAVATPLLKQRCTK